MSPGKIKLAKRNFRDLWNGLNSRVEVLGDIRLAAFLTQHWFTEPVCLASVGIPSEQEFLALNSLADPLSSFVILSTDSFDNKRAAIKQFSDRATLLDFDIRTQVADLTLPGRWAQLLPALAVKNIGLSAFDAGWAIKEPTFWDNMRKFILESKSIVYMRGALDYRHPGASVRFLRSIPDDCPIELIAATRTSLWFGPSGEDASSLRKALATCGQFGDLRCVGDVDEAIVVENTWSDNWVQDDGRSPRAVYVGQVQDQSSIDYRSGWAAPEPDGRWTDGKKATLRVALPEGAAKPKRISICGNAWVSKVDLSQTVYVGVGPEPERWVEQRFEHGGDIRVINLDLATADAVEKFITVHVRVEKPGRPSDFGDPDSRVLGFKFRSLSIYT